MADGVDFHEWSIVRSKPWTSPGAIRQLRALVAELKPDVIHLHSFMAGLVGRLPGVLPSDVDAAVVYQPHAWSFDCTPTSSGRAWSRRRSAGPCVVRTCW